MLLAVDVTRSEAAAYGERVQPWLGRMEASADLLYADAQALPHISDPKVRERAMQEWHAARKEDLDKLKAFLDTYVPTNCNGVIRLEQGDPADVLVRVSHEYDLIIVGSKPRARPLGGRVRLCSLAPGSGGRMRHSDPTHHAR